MDSHGGPYIGRVSEARRTSLDWRKENVLMGQGWKQQEMGSICPHGDLPTGVGESANA